jgi:hypothetical protein
MEQSMSKLEFWARPLVAFDPHNKEHRAIYSEFVKKPGWGHSPYRFICPDVRGMNLVSMIQQKMLEYYIKREFKEPKPLVSQKRTKLVDKV